MDLRLGDIVPVWDIVAKKRFQYGLRLLRQRIGERDQAHGWVQ